jgi:arylsulfatase A-like enzyme
VDLLPFLTNHATGAPHETLFWKLGGNSAVRKGRWKLFLEPRKGVAMLFDLETDPAEKRDLSAEHPEMFEELKALYAQWDSSLPPRAWTNISPVFKK